MAQTGKAAEAKFEHAPGNVTIDEKVIKKLAGEAVAGIDGVLGMKGGLGDILKDENDPTRGVTVSMDDRQNVTLCIKIITEKGKNIPGIVNAATAAVTDSLQNTTGLTVAEVAIEVVDTMDRAEYEQDNILVGTTPM